MSNAGKMDDEAAPRDGDRPECFGDPGAVCPRDERGFIQPQAGCLSCKVVRECLQLALRSEGVIAGPGKGAAVASRVTGFLKRWSSQKLSGSKPGGKPPA